MTECFEDIPVLDFPRSTLLHNILRNYLETPLGDVWPFGVQSLLFWSWNVFHAVILIFWLLCLQWLRKGLSKLFCSMEKEDLKVLNKGEEEEMVCFFLILHQCQDEISYFVSCVTTVFFLYLLGAARLPSVSLAAGPCGPRRAVYRGLPPPGALLDARVVC